MIVVTTPTGRIGSRLLPHLLGAGESVRVIARNPAKLAPEVRDHVEVVQGSQDDPAVLAQALAGADSLFFVVPPSFQTTNDTPYYISFAEPASAAIQQQNVQRVVMVSVLGKGSDLAAHAGPITASLAKDAVIEETGVDLRTLWCPAFMDNMLMQVDSLKNQGVFYMPSRGDVKTPQAATQDIAAAGAKLLLDRSWTGQGGVAVLGPEDLSFNDMADIMTDVLGKPIRFQSVPGDAYQEQLVQHGANPVFAHGIVEMMAAKDAGLDNAEVRTAENTTPTSFRQWCEEVLKPAVQS